MSAKKGEAKKGPTQFQLFIQLLLNDALHLLQIFDEGSVCFYRILVEKLEQRTKMRR